MSERPIETAERVLGLVRARAESAEAEVAVQTGTQALTRFANRFIHQNVAEEVRHVSIRVAVDGRTAATAFDGPPTDEALGRTIDGLIEAARVRPEDPDWPGVAEPAPAPEVDHWDDATASASADERARRIADFVAAADGLETAGFCDTNVSDTAFGNSAGQRLTGRGTSAALDGIARTGTSDGAARDAGVALGPLDGRQVGEVAARKAREAADPGEIEPGRYEVVLEPQCVANLIQFLFIYGFNGLAVEEGRSFVRVGETQFDSALTLVDDPSDPGQIGVAWDIEGTPRRRTEVVSAGVSQGVLHTRRTGAKAGVPSTGHAFEGAEGYGALPANPVLSSGDRTLDELVRSMERGILVTDFWYTRVLDPRTLVVTGLTRNGVWLVEDGQVVRPVSNLRFTQSFVEALAPGAVRGIGSDRALVSEGWGGAYLVPALHLGTWNFTGGAKG
jgi:predicted Zn-dependent protease